MIAKTDVSSTVTKDSGSMILVLVSRLYFTVSHPVRSKCIPITNGVYIPILGTGSVDSIKHNVDVPSVEMITISEDRLDQSTLHCAELWCQKWCLIISAHRYVRGSRRDTLFFDVVSHGVIYALLYVHLFNHNYIMYSKALSTIVSRMMMTVLTMMIHNVHGHIKKGISLFLMT